MKLSLTFVLAGLSALVSADIHTKRASSVSDVQVLNYALTLEYLEKTFYNEGLQKYSDAEFKKAGYPPYVRQRVLQIGKQEKDHAQTLAAVLGRNAVKPCRYSFPYNSVDEFLAIARILEGVGVSAYAGAAPFIHEKNYLEVAATILSTEARHQAVLAEFQHQDGVPAPYDTPLDFSQVYSLAAAFIQSCPSENGKGNKLPPIRQFPTLSYTGTVKEGSKITFAWSGQKKNKTYYVHFLNGINSVTVQVNSNNQVSIPFNLPGRTYMVMSAAKVLSDSTTVAGPAFFEISRPDKL